jgi:chromosome segregation ATPase
MPNQNDNKIAALKNEGEALNALLQEYQKRVDSFTAYVARTAGDEEVEVEVEVEPLPMAKDARLEEIEAQQQEIVDTIETLETGIAKHDAKIKGFKDEKKALQDLVEDEQTPRKLLISRLKTQRGKLEKLGVVIEEISYGNPEEKRVVNTEVDGKPANIRFTQLEEFKQPYTEDPDYHVGAPGRDATEY